MRPPLETKNLILTSPSLEDFSSIMDFEIRNQNHLKQWESTSLGENTSFQEAVRKRLENWLTDFTEGKAVRFLMRMKDKPAEIIGFCHFTQIFYGAFRACYLGYKIDYQYEGKGLMFEALEASIRYIFEELGLHRIMANY